MMYCVSTVFNTIGTLITKASPVGGNEQLDMIGKFQATGLLMGILIPVVIGPVLEELIFRKLMIDRIRCYGETNAIIFSAVCFGLFHGNLTQCLYAGCAGLFLGYVYCKTGNVLYTMVMHMLLNGFSSLILAAVPLFDSSDPDGMAVGFLLICIFVLVISAIMLAGFILLIRWIKQKKFTPDNSMPECIPQNEILKTVWLNPGMILFLAVSIFGIAADLFNIDISLSPKTS